MTDRRTKFIRKSETGKGWEYGYSKIEILPKERKVIDDIVGKAPTLEDATLVWLEQKQAV
ncbi:MAG: hypothetical protein KGZ83_21065 [Sulfuricella sp.]|nr:hypothetical protein [Sulfuricella sp.]